MPLGFEITQQYEPVRFCRRFTLLCAQQAEKKRFFPIRIYRRNANGHANIGINCPMYIFVRRRRAVAHCSGRVAQRKNTIHVRRL